MLLQSENADDLIGLKIELANCYKEIVTHLQNRLPHDSNIVKDLQYFNPTKLKLRGKALFAITRISTTMGVVLRENVTKAASIDQFFRSH